MAQGQRQAPLHQGRHRLKGVHQAQVRYPPRKCSRCRRHDETCFFFSVEAAHHGIGRAPQRNSLPGLPGSPSPRQTSAKSRSQGTAKENTGTGPTSSPHHYWWPKSTKEKPGGTLQKLCQTVACIKAPHLLPGERAGHPARQRGAHRGNPRKGLTTRRNFPGGKPSPRPEPWRGSKLHPFPPTP